MGLSFNKLTCNGWQNLSSTFGTGYPEHPLKVVIPWTITLDPVIVHRGKNCVDLINSSGTLDQICEEIPVAMPAEIDILTLHPTPPYTFWTLHPTASGR